MPWHIGTSDQCPSSKPFAVIKSGTSEVEGCHESKEKARRQLAALYSSEGKAELSTETRNRLPDSAFACPEKRLYPHHHADGSLDLPHLRNALSRVNQEGTDSCGKAHLEAHAKAEGIGERSESKAILPVKAQLMDTDELEAWFAGRIPRRLLAIPFGGPIPSAKSSLGVDIDGDWFSPRTDIYGPYKELRQTRDRLLDFHHSYMPPTPRHGDPLGKMSGVILGKSVLDDEPEEDGWWADVWFKHGEQRVNLVKALVKRGAMLFGSSQRVPGDTLRQDPVTGEILQWPHLLQTLSPSPQNTFSRFASAKATLDALDSAEVSVDKVLRDFLTDLDNLGADLPLTWLSDQEYGDVAAKAGRVLSARNEQALREALAVVQRYLDLMAGAPTEPPTEGDASP